MYCASPRLLDQHSLGGDQIDKLLVVAVVIVGQGVEVFQLRLEARPDGRFEFGAIAVLFGRACILQDFQGLLVDVAQGEAVGGQLQQCQFDLALKFLLQLGVADVFAQAGKFFALLPQEQSDFSRDVRVARRFDLLGDFFVVFSHGGQLVVDLLLLARDVGDGLGQGLATGGQSHVRFGQIAEHGGGRSLPRFQRGMLHLLLGLLLPPPIREILQLLDFLLGQSDLPRLEVVMQRQQLGPRFVGRQLLLVTNDLLFHPATLGQKDHAAGETHRRLFVARRRRLKLGVDLRQRLLRFVDLLGYLGPSSGTPLQFLLVVGQFLPQLLQLGLTLGYGLLDLQQRGVGTNHGRRLGRKTGQVGFCLRNVLGRVGYRRLILRNLRSPPLHPVHFEQGLLVHLFDFCLTGVVQIGHLADLLLPCLQQRDEFRFRHRLRRRGLTEGRRCKEQPDKGLRQENEAVSDGSHGKYCSGSFGQAGMLENGGTPGK